MKRRAQLIPSPALAACLVAAATVVVGGACLYGNVPPDPKLIDGPYVLTTANGNGLPALFADSAGRTLRVLADTFVIHTAAGTYEEHATVAITPPGGSEQPAAPFTVATRSYSMPTATATTFKLPTTLYGGSIQGAIRAPANFVLFLTAGAPWAYEHR